MAYIRQMLEEKYLKGELPSNNTANAGQFDLQNQELTNEVAKLSETIENLKSNQRELAAKVEDYKDDFVNRLSVQRSFDDGLTASTRHSKTNPLVSPSSDRDGHR